MSEVKTKKYNIISPDGFPISMDNFETLPEAWSYFDTWASGFERQGYYSSNNARIALSSLREHVTEKIYN